MTMETRHPRNFPAAHPRRLRISVNLRHDPPAVARSKWRSNDFKGTEAGIILEFARNAEPVISRHRRKPFPAAQGQRRMAAAPRLPQKNRRPLVCSTSSASAGRKRQSSPSMLMSLNSPGTGWCCSPAQREYRRVSTRNVLCPAATRPARPCKTGIPSVPGTTRLPVHAHIHI